MHVPHLPVALTLDSHTVWLACASLLAGALNSVAGGGSFLSFPALLNMHVPPIEANATNTVALWPGQLASIAGYRRDFAENRRLILPVAAASFTGGAAGAFLLLHTRADIFLHLVPWLLLVAASLFVCSAPLSQWLARRNAAPVAASAPPRLPVALCVLVISLYMGYFGAGGGFLLLALFAFAGVGSLHQMNAVKVMSTTLSNGAAVLLFIVHGYVLWQPCLLMMAASVVGGYAGARNARRVNPTVMRAFVTVLGFSVAAYFFWRYGF